VSIDGVALAHDVSRESEGWRINLREPVELREGQKVVVG
jgi:hypothetical protein